MFTCNTALNEARSSNGEGAGPTNSQPPPSSDPLFLALIVHSNTRMYVYYICVYLRTTNTTWGELPSTCNQQHICTVCWLVGRLLVTLLNKYNTYICFVTYFYSFYTFLSVMSLRSSHNKLITSLSLSLRASICVCLLFIIYITLPHYSLFLSLFIFFLSLFISLSLFLSTSSPLICIVVCIMYV